MKLYFSKDAQNEIVIKMSTGTVIEEFSYIEMIKNLLLDNKFDDTEYSEDITDDEKERIETMLSSINESIIIENIDEDKSETE